METALGPVRVVCGDKCSILLELSLQYFRSMVRYVLAWNAGLETKRKWGSVVRRERSRQLARPPVGNRSLVANDQKAILDSNVMPGGNPSSQMSTLPCAM